MNPQPLTVLTSTYFRFDGGFFRHYDERRMAQLPKIQKGVTFESSRIPTKVQISTTAKKQRKHPKPKKKLKHNHKPTTQLGQVLYFFEIILKFFIKVIVSVGGITSALRKFALGFFEKRPNFKVLQQQESLDDQPGKNALLSVAFELFVWSIQNWSHL